MAVDQLSLTKEAVRLESRKRELKTELKKVETELANLEDPLLEQMALSGTQSQNMNGFTVYRKTSRFVKKTDPQQLAFELKQTDMAYLVTEGVNSNSLRSAVLERIDDEDQEVPEGVMRCIEITEIPKLGFRKS